MSIPTIIRWVCFALSIFEIYNLINQIIQDHHIGIN